MLAEEEAASENDHQKDRTTQDAQENYAPEFEQLAMCIHDVPGGCWLCRRVKAQV
jgi:hypothetical protein